MGRGCLQFRGAGLAGHFHPGDRRCGAGAEAHHVEHHAPHRACRRGADRAPAPPRRAPPAVAALPPSRPWRRAPPASGATPELGAGRRPPSAIVAATVAISRGLASTWSWPIAVEPTASSPWIWRGWRDRALGRPFDPGGVVEADTVPPSPPAAPRPASRPAGRTPSCTTPRTPPPASLRIPRRSRCAVAPRPASPRSRRGTCSVGRRDPRFQHPAHRDHLERRPRRLQRVQADPRHSQHLAAGRFQRDHPAVLAAQRASPTAVCTAGEIVVRTALPACALALASTRSPPSLAVAAAWINTPPAAALLPIVRPAVRPPGCPAGVRPPPAPDRSRPRSRSPAPPAPPAHAGCLRGSAPLRPPPRSPPPPAGS